MLKELCVQIILLALYRLPGSLRQSVLKKFFGWDIAPSARIGMSIISSKYVFMGEGSTVGHFNVFRNLEKLTVGPRSIVGQWNWMSASPMLVERFAGASGEVNIGSESAITSRHYIDASGGFSVGSFSTFAGNKSTVLTHGIDFESSTQTASPVSIGDYCFIGSDCRIVAGSSIHDHIVVAMGAVVVGDLQEEFSLYGGVPAQFIKRLEGAKYFSRANGWVGVADSIGGDVDGQ